MPGAQRYEFWRSPVKSISRKLTHLTTSAAAIFEWSTMRRKSASVNGNKGSRQQLPQPVQRNFKRGKLAIVFDLAA